MSQNVKDIIRAIAGPATDNLFVAKVVMLDENTCTVESGDMLYSDVQLFSSNVPGNLLIKPALNSRVLVADLSNGLRRRLCLIKVDEVQLIELKQDKLQFTIDAQSGTLQLNAQGVSLGKILAELMQLLRQFKVNVLAPNAPSGPPTPDVVTKLIELEQNIKTLLP
ncbi:MAG: hypothetical protein IPM52_13205 [Bacteroidetes bacterium]|nr:hypothetical protein [Bacteroidota bacterium]